MHTTSTQRRAATVLPAPRGSPFPDHLTLCARRLTLAHGAFEACRPDPASAPARLARHRPEMPRRRIAILAGDIVGYSRLIEFDDVGTVARLRVLRRELLDPAAAACRARLVRHTADAVLAGFDEPADAVACALTLQSVLFLFNRSLRERRSIRLRIGLSVGEALFMDDDVHGTGVNVAARLQALAEPGEILLCERAFLQVRELFPAAFEGLGPRQLHNISRPVHVFRIGLEAIERFAAQNVMPVPYERPSVPWRVPLQAGAAGTIAYPCPA